MYTYKIYYTYIPPDYNDISPLTLIRLRWLFTSLLTQCGGGFVVVSSKSVSRMLSSFVPGRKQGSE